MWKFFRSVCLRKVRRRYGYALRAHLVYLSGKNSNAKHWKFQPAAWEIAILRHFPVRTPHTCIDHRNALDVSFPKPVSICKNRASTKGYGRSPFAGIFRIWAGIGFQACTAPTSIPIESKCCVQTEKHIPGHRRPSHGALPTQKLKISFIMGLI